jgi:hypothetical protein
MKLFRRHYSPEEVGAMIYEALRAGMASDGELSVKTLLDNLDRTEADLHDQYVGELMVGAMFGALLAIDRSTSHWIGEQICQGMHKEFHAHLAEQGASDEQVREWRAVVQGRFLEYRQCMEQYEGFEPPWKLGRQLFWNITGVEDYLAMSIKIATLYVLAARDAVQPLLNQYGPSIVVLPPT